MVVLVEKQAQGVGLITLNRPEAMNALSNALRRGIAEAVTSLDADEAVRAIVLTGAGRAFCAGLDLKELSKDVSPLDQSAGHSTITDIISAVDGCRKPVIGAINGAAITGGFELALACDILIGSVNARFSDTHARIGVLPGWGLSQKLPRIIGPSRAKEMSLTGNFIDAHTALEWGILNHVTPAYQLLDRALGLARDIASAPAEMTLAYNDLIDEGYVLAFGEAMQHEREVSAKQSVAVRSDEVDRRRAEVVARGRAKASE